MKVYFTTTVNGEEILVTDNTEIGDADFAEIGEADYAMLEELLETPISENFNEKALKHFDLEDALNREKKEFLMSLLIVLEEMAINK